MQSKSLKIKSVYWTWECSDWALETCLPTASLYPHLDGPLLIREAGLQKAQECDLNIRKGKEKLVQALTWVLDWGANHWKPRKYRKMVPGLCFKADTTVSLQGLFVCLVLTFLQAFWSESPLCSEFGRSLLETEGLSHAPTQSLCLQ